MLKSAAAYVERMRERLCFSPDASRRLLIDLAPYATYDAYFDASLLMFAAAADDTLPPPLRRLMPFMFIDA